MGVLRDHMSSTLHGVLWGAWRRFTAAQRPHPGPRRPRGRRAGECWLIGAKCSELSEILASEVGLSARSWWARKAWPVHMQWTMPPSPPHCGFTLRGMLCGAWRRCRIRSSATLATRAICGFGEFDKHESKLGLTRAEHVAVCMEPLTLLRPRYRQHMREQRRILDEADVHDGASSHHITVYRKSA